MKLILIDDESATRNGLLRHISWLSLGVDQIRAVADANEALKICESWKPDIILSDIRMPEMDGITLCNKIKKTHVNCQIIFISGYADKEILIQAIGLGAVSFVEKPIDLPKLEKAIEIAVKKRIEKDRHSSNRQILQQNLPIIEMEVVNHLIKGKLTEYIQNSARIFNLSANYQVILFRAKDDFESRAAFGSCIISNFPEIFEECHYIKGYQSTKEMVCILFDIHGDLFAPNSQTNIQIKKDLVKLKERGIALFCAVGKPVAGVTQVHYSYESAVKSMRELFFKEYGNLSYMQSSFQKNRKQLDWQLRQKCLQAIQNYDYKETQQIVETIYNTYMVRKTMEEEEIREFFFQINYALFQLTKEEKEQSIYDMENIWKSIRKKDTMLQLKEEFLEQLDFRMNHLKKISEISDTVFLIQKRIHQEYSDENLNIMKLAESVYLTPTYLSSIFKKEMNMTIGQYITQVRISYAKKYLKDKSLKLYQIAEKCGYNDPNYFAKIFRKNVGMTPSEYRGKREWEKE